MMARRRVLGLLGGGLAFVLGGCGLFGPSTFRYRMRVEVETPEGLRSGFAVRQMWFSQRTNGGYYAQAEGEAVAVDLPGSKTLFALLSGADGNVDYAGHGIWTIFTVMDRDIGPKGGPHELWPKIPVIREPITNPVPMLVKFADIADPKSVERVDPADLAASFGPGVRLTRIVVEKTSEAVTSGIQERLAWLAEVGKTRSTLIPNPPRLLKDAKPIQLVGSDKFSTELFK